MQAGEFAFVAGGEIVMLDEKESRMYAYSADGQDLGHFGSRGAGPGEFQGNAHLVPWAGDTVAVYAGDQFHVVLFKGHRYERTLGLPRSLGPGSTIAGGRMSGENGVVFGSLDPVDYVPKETEIIRPTFSLVLWQPGSSVVIPVRREIPASEFTVWTIGGGWGNGRRLTVFGRKTFIGVLRDQVALLDNATQAVELTPERGDCIDRFSLGA